MLRHEPSVRQQKNLFSERQAALKNIRPKAWVWMWRMFVKGEARLTQEGGETQGDWFGGLSNPRKRAPGNGPRWDQELKMGGK